MYTAPQLPPNRRCHHRQSQSTA